MEKSKSPHPDRFTVKFYLGFYDLLKDDLLIVVKESKDEGGDWAQLMPPFSA